MPAAQPLTATPTVSAEPRQPAIQTRLHLTYQGWSGCLLDCQAPDVPPLVIDPSPDADLPTTELVIAITHGHPEHVQGAARHLMRSERAAVRVLASSHVCRFLQARTANAGDQFVAINDAQQIDIRGWRIRVFAWQHMSLVPPSLFLAARHLLKLALHPIRFLRIAVQSANGPRHAPMLGFVIQPPDSHATLVYYGEGLHRLTAPAELTRAFGDGVIDALITAVEPEDIDQLPALLAPHRIKHIYTFEAHREWRTQFGLPQIDMPDMLNRFRATSHPADALVPGQPIELG